MTHEEREVVRGYMHAVQALTVAVLAMLEPDGADVPTIESADDIQEPQESGPRVFGRKAG